jgi:hypothetical protein
VSAWCSPPRAGWVADNPRTTHHWSAVLRLPLRASGLFAAAALAGAFVYWRASDRYRSRLLADEVQAGIGEGQEAASALLKGADDDGRPFDQR